jgi:hypothetical protein
MFAIGFVCQARLQVHGVATIRCSASRRMMERMWTRLDGKKVTSSTHIRAHNRFAVQLSILGGCDRRNQSFDRFKRSSRGVDRDGPVAKRRRRTTKKK